ncbi:NAD(P)-binding domain-containing protein [Streptomyces sp.]|uniref:NAD(P)-binding domain-containing protein n=1 Tax=Streptomyces sp. TaxID=1931 RepID=UPI002D78579C|nr:NAD(P)-binding domain-containing protein [Streptomyces sp.]HET6353500.1 NAD(P)-binding domain-containing protein [Streptomyces sp.]
MTTHKANDANSARRSRTMRIGILGTGAMAAALGGAWVRAGHEVMVGGRDTAATARTAAGIGAAGHGSLTEAARYGEAVLVAVPADIAPQLAKALAPALAGRTMLDCTVPMAPAADGPALTTAGGTDSVAARLAAAAPDACVAKVFGIPHESIWTLPRPAFEGAPLAVPFCTDAPLAAALTAELITSMGCAPLPCGGLHRAALLEAAAVFAIGVWWSGGEARHAFPAPALAPGAVDDAP